MTIHKRLSLLQQLAGLSYAPNLDKFILDKFPDCTAISGTAWKFSERGIYKYNLIRANIFWNEVYRQWKEYILFADGSLFDGQEGNIERIHELIDKLINEVKK